MRLTLFSARTLPVAAAFLLHAGGACAAARDLPPPGLYRVDTATRVGEKVGPHVATIDFHTDGASGNQSSRAVVAGRDDGGRMAKGDGPVTQCIRSGPPVVLPPSGKGVCKPLSTSQGEGGYVQVAACPVGKLTLTMRRLDDKTWETVTEIDMASGSRPNLDGTKALLEMAARHGTSAREREEAARALAQMPRMQAAMESGQAGADATLQQALAAARTPQEKALARQAIARMNGQVPMKTRSRATLTRIADTCPPG